MKVKKYRNIRIQVLLIAFYVVFLFGCKEKGSEADHKEIQKVSTVSVETIKAEKPNENAIELPPFSDGIYPCSDCHSDLVPNPVKRELTEMHEEISAMFDHDKENRWCTDCHDLNNRDFLKLASGKLLDFKESYKLCGQCHGEKLRDWKVGVHGKRTGYWNGKKEYMLCVHCHNPHSPKFKELTPEPPPIRQEDIN
ncbi:MAG: cytochrome c3 family protein [Bacteroidota bacterium]|nr:cytochrome c3 family protein [Bacteroidota bacterium]